MSSFKNHHTIYVSLCSTFPRLSLDLKRLLHKHYSLKAKFCSNHTLTPLRRFLFSIGVLGILYAAGLLEKEIQKGSTNIYRVAPPSRWKEPGELQKIRMQRKDAENVNSLGKIENAELTDVAIAS
jgi:hypothetical protein